MHSHSQVLTTNISNYIEELLNVLKQETPNNAFKREQKAIEQP